MTKKTITHPHFAAHFDKPERLRAARELLTAVTPVHGARTGVLIHMASYKAARLFDYLQPPHAVRREADWDVPASRSAATGIELTEPRLTLATFDSTGRVGPGHRADGRAARVSPRSEDVPQGGVFMRATPTSLTDGDSGEQDGFIFTCGVGSGCDDD